MAGASGGVADKLGNKYELAWAIRHALLCIGDERRSLTLEEIDPELADGSEFTYVNEHGDISVTQVKRQNNITDHWTIAALRGRGVLAAAARHVAAGHEFHFSSMTPSGALRVLADLSRQSADAQQFVAHQLTRQLRPTFDELTATNAFGSPEAAWLTLRGMRVEIEVEEQLVMTNAMLAEMSLEGATGDLMAVAVGAVLLDNLRTRMTRRELLDALARDGIAPRGSVARRTSHEQVMATTQSWRSTIEREMLSPPIERQEATALVDLMVTTRIALVIGAGGGGKSSVLYQAARHFEAQDAEVLAFRLDRRGAFGSTIELGAQLGLSMSPVAALRMAADGRDAFLIIDQLDAVSLASGRLSERYDVIADLIQEATAVDGVRVILACRLFDVENDHRIRKLDARNDVERLIVEPLPEEAVTGAVLTMGLDPELLTATQRALLRSPLNLVLLETIADQPGALNFTSRGSLFEAFWQRKEQTSEERRPGTMFNDVLARIANTASDYQTLSVHVEILGPGDLIKHARVLASEQVLAIEDDRVSFFHETFFDFTFARQWLSRQQSMVEFLCAQEQELFRRAQVRQILELLRERDPDRFRTEVEAVLGSADVRFHIKETVVAVFANISSPEFDDVELVLRLAETESTLTKRLWLQIARPTWFEPFYAHGHIQRWLDSDDAALRERSVNWMGNAGAEHGADVADLLTARKQSPDYVMWLRSLTRRADLHNHHRRLFDLLLDAVRAGDINPTDQNLWLSAHELAEHQPTWAIDMLKACFVESPTALALGSDGKVILLGIHEYGATQMIEAACKAEPQAFAEAFVPHLLAVMEATQYDRHEENLLQDRHFSLRLPTEPSYDDVDDAFYNGAAVALEQWAQTSPDTIESMLQLLAASEHDAAQALLYRALIAGAAHFAPWAAELILEGGNRLQAGYISDSHWLSREVVEAIAPIVSDQVHMQLEEQLRDLPATYQSSDLHHRLQSFGYTAFKFLSALDFKRLTPLGLRRLQEYQRKFDRDSPEPPTGIITYSVGSPIGGPATGKMSNAQWLKAMAKHDTDDRDFGSEVGGARELAQQLKARTAEDPLRFAGLAMQLTPETYAAYPSAILGGFGEATVPGEAQHGVFDAVRHIMSLGFDDCDRWLGWAVRHLYDEAPLDIVEMVLDRALHAPDPVDDSPVFERRDGRPGRDLFQNGYNTSRGSLAESLGDLLIHDSDGTRTELVAPRLVELASDHVLSVRACVAHTVAACLRHARPTAYAAFERLIDADDLLLASDRLDDLMIYIGNVDPDVVDPVIARMLNSTDAEVRRAGGCMAAFAALQWARPSLMEGALTRDVEVRAGLAEVCAARIDRSADSELVLSTLRRLMHDGDDEVRKKVGTLARHLRRNNLRPYAGFLADLIASPSYAHATPQLLITLQEAPDKVDDLVGLAAHRFLDIHEDDVADIRTGAAGDTHYISDLVVRGLAQTPDRGRITALLDILDRLLELGVYGVNRAIDGAVRN